MSLTQFAVVWKRDGLRQKRRVFARRASAERWLRLLGPEPWLAFPDKEPDELQCCSGYQCGCEGKTLREDLLASRAQFPALEYMRLETRGVTEWAVDPSSPAQAQLENPHAAPLSDTKP